MTPIRLTARSGWLPVARVFSLIAILMPLLIHHVPRTAADVSVDPLADMEVKANDYLQNIISSHLLADQVLSLDLGGQFQDQGDSAIWTGLYAAAEAFHYQANGDVSALTNLANILDALHLLQFDPTQPGVLTRFLDNGQPYIPGNPERSFVSKDTYAGVLFGYATAYSRLPDGPKKDQVRADVLAIADNFLSNSHMFRGQYTGATGTEPILVDLNPGITLDTVDYAFEKHPTLVDQMVEQLEKLKENGYLSMALIWFKIASLPFAEYVIDRWNSPEATGGEHDRGAWCESNEQTGWVRNPSACWIRRNMTLQEVMAERELIAALYSLLWPVVTDGTIDNDPRFVLDAQQSAIKSFVDDVWWPYHWVAPSPTPCGPQLCPDAQRAYVLAAFHDHWDNGVTALINALLRLAHALPSGATAMIRESYTSEITAGRDPDYLLRKYFDPQWVAIVHDWYINPSYYENLLMTVTGNLPVSIGCPEDVQVVGTNALLSLYVLKIAAAVTGEARFQQEYDAIKSDYIAVAQAWNVPEESVTTGLLGDAIADASRQSGSHLKWLALYQLLALETDPTTRTSYVNIMNDLFSYTSDERNALANFIHRSQADPAQIDPQATQQATESLWLFPPYGNQIFAYACSDGVVQSDFGGCVEIAGKEMARNAIPLDKRPRDTFTWQRNPRQLKNDPAERIYPGIDFLLAYWLGRAHGVLDVNVQPIIGLAPSVSHAGPPGQPTSLLAHIDSGTYVQYSWNFGDGTVGTGGLAQHVYTTPGRYWATVTARNPLGSTIRAFDFYVQDRFRLSVTKWGLGTGTVRSNPPGIVCGSAGHSCQADYDPGTGVTLTVEVDPGNRHTVCHLFGCGTEGPHPDYFDGWSGDCSGTGACALTMNSNYGVTATICDGDNGCFTTGGSSGSGGSVGSGGQGGMESWPLWMFHTDQEMKIPPSILEQMDLSPSPLWKWGNGVTHETVLNQPRYSIALQEVMPPPAEDETQSFMVPRDVIGNSNAVESLASDYLVPPDDEVIASVVAFRSVDTVYSHEMAVCERFKGDSVLTAYQTSLEVPQPDATTLPLPVWQTVFVNNDGWTSRFADTFAVYISDDETTGTVQSQWLTDEYPSATDGYILTFQVWSADPNRTNQLAQQVLSQLAGLGVQLSAFPTTGLADVFFSAGGYGRDHLDLTVINSNPMTQTATIVAAMWSAPYPASNSVITFTQEIRPGSNALVLPAPNELNGVVYLDGGTGFVDKVYVANGTWAAFDDSGDGGTSVAYIESADCLPYSGPETDAHFAGCGELTGNVTGSSGYIGMFREVATNDLTFDASAYDHLAFLARGDGRDYHVKLETLTSDGQRYQYGYEFAAPTDWDRFDVPFADFIAWGNAPALNPGLLRAITWATAGSPYESVDLLVDQVAVYAMPAVPTGVIASDGTYADRIVITWLESPGATSYEVWRNSANDSGSATRIASDIAATTFDDLAVELGQNYFYWIAARAASRVSSLSLPDSGYRRPPIPDAISDLVLSTTIPHCILTWSHFDTDTAYYTLYRSENPYFVPGAANSVIVESHVPPPSVGTLVSYTDIGMCGASTAQSFYAVVSIGVYGGVSEPSNRVGLVEFELQPGVASRLWLR